MNAVTKSAFAGPPADLFYPISGARAHEEVALQITYAIRSGAYAIRARLPSIETLSNIMEVSRPTVGQALKLLSDAVKSNSPPDRPLWQGAFAAHFGLLDVLEARRALEVQIAILAAERGTPEHFSELRKNLKHLENSLDCEPGARVLHDHGFHYLLGRMCGNRVLAMYQHQVLERIYFELSERNFFTHDEDVLSVLYWHKRTYRAIKRGNPDLIRKVVHGHLRPLEEYAERRQKSLA